MIFLHNPKPKISGIIVQNTDFSLFLFTISSHFMFLGLIPCAFFIRLLVIVLMMLYDEKNTCNKEP